MDYKNLDRNYTNFLLIVRNLYLIKTNFCRFFISFVRWTPVRLLFTVYRTYFLGTLWLIEDLKLNFFVFARDLLDVEVPVMMKTFSC